MMDPIVVEIERLLMNGSPQEQAQAKRLVELVLLSAGQDESLVISPDTASHFAKRTCLKYAAGYFNDINHLERYLINCLTHARQTRYASADNSLSGLDQNHSDLRSIDEPGIAASDDVLIDLIRSATTSADGSSDVFALRVLYCHLHGVHQCADIASSLGADVDPHDVRYSVDIMRKRLRQSGIEQHAQEGPRPNNPETSTETKTINTVDFFLASRALSNNNGITQIGELAALLQWDENKTAIAARRMNTFRLLSSRTKEFDFSKMDIRLDVPLGEEELWIAIQQHLFLPLPTGVHRVIKASD